MAKILAPSGRPGHERFFSTFVARTSWHMNDNYIDLSAHMHASQAQVEGCRTSLEVEYKGPIYGISGLVTRLGCILCRLTFVLFWCYP